MNVIHFKHFPVIFCNIFDFFQNYVFYFCSCDFIELFVDNFIFYITFFVISNLCQNSSILVTWLNGIAKKVAD